MTSIANLSATRTTSTNPLDFPLDILDIILELFALDNGSPVLFTHLNRRLRKTLLLQQMVWARISFFSNTDVGYRRFRTFLKRAGATCPLDITFDFGIDSSALNHRATWHKEQIDSHVNEVAPYLARIKRLTVIENSPHVIDYTTTSLLSHLTNSTSSSAQSYIHDVIAGVDSPPQELEHPASSNSNTRTLSLLSALTLKSTRITVPILPRLFEFLHVCSSTLVSLTLDANLSSTDCGSSTIHFPCLRHLSIKTDDGTHWWNNLDTPVIERVSVKFLQPRCDPLAFLQFIRHHSRSLREIGVHYFTDPWRKAPSYCIKDINFSFPVLKELDMRTSDAATVLGNIQSAPALRNLKITSSRGEFDSATPNIPQVQVYPSLVALSINHHIDLLQSIRAPVLTSVTIKGSISGVPPVLVDFLHRHADTIVQLSVQHTYPVPSPGSTIDTNEIGFKALSFPRLKVLDFTLGGSLPNIQAAAMPRLDQITIQSHDAGPDNIQLSPWTMKPSNFRGVSTLNLTIFIPTERSSQLLRQLFGVSNCLSHLTIGPPVAFVLSHDTHAMASISVMSMLAESPSCAFLTTLDLIAPPEAQKILFYVALKRLVSACRAATARKLGRVTLAQAPFRPYGHLDQETHSWLQENITKLILPGP